MTRLTRLQAARLLRLAARIWSVAAVTFVLLILIGEILAGITAGEALLLPTATEWLGLLFFPTLVLLGLVIAWRFELSGGIISLLGLVGFYLWQLLRSGAFPRGPYILLVAAPALLFVIAALLDGERAMPAPSTGPRDRTMG